MVALLIVEVYKWGASAWKTKPAIAWSVRGACSQTRHPMAVVGAGTVISVTYLNVAEALRSKVLCFIMS
jgi:hypothetical protein